MTPVHPTVAASAPSSGQLSRGAAATCGAVGAAVALGVGELVAALLGAPVSLVTAVGAEFVDRFAATLKDIAIAVFGTNDKIALVVGIVLTSVLVGAALGLVGRWSKTLALIGFLAFGGLGVWSLASDPRGSVGVAALVGLAAVSVGLGTMWGLERLAGRIVPAVEPSAAERHHRTTTIDRRGFVLGVGAFVTLAATSGVAARAVRAGSSVESARRTTLLPRPGRQIRVPSRQPFVVEGLAPYVTPTSDFYRIDTALATPQVDAGSWRLRIGGLVDRPFELDYEELLRLDSIEVPVTITCVSNEVGGRLVGTAVWQGVPLRDLLDRAGLRSDAAQVVARSVDGFTAGFPTATALDGRTALVAYAMNGEPLPADHGYPARLIVSGLYGYVSATKWLERLELTTWDGFDGYWVPRGWAKEGPIKTQSRIDVPADGSTVPASMRPIAGVAWAPDRGISAVEVQIDDGPWRRADLGAVAGNDTWVQWHLAWDARPGEHRIRVRATDGTGATQTGRVSRPAPDGATGWHTHVVRVT